MLDLTFFYREEKTEALLESKEELEYHKILVTKLKQEVRHFLYISLVFFSKYQKCINFFIIVLEPRINARSTHSKVL